MTVETVGQPKLSHSAAAIRVFAMLAVSGAVVGGLWALLAPPVHGAVVLSQRGERVSGFLGDESDRLFLGAFLMVGFLGVLAVVATAAVWWWRAHRGPQMVAALSLGALAAGGIGSSLGNALVHWRYGTVDVAAAPISPEHRVFYTTEAPSAFFGQSPWLIAATVVFPAGVAALLYALCALAAKRDDLAAWPPVERVPRPPVPVTDGVSNAD